MRLGIESCLELLDCATVIAVESIEIAKAKSISFGQISNLLKIANMAAKAWQTVPEALPELKDLDKSEVGALGTAAYSSFEAIVAAVRGG